MRPMLRVCLGLAFGLASARVEAQPATPSAADRWEVEVHGGGLLSSTPESGTFALPAAGPFVPPNLNRPVSSWYLATARSS